MSDKIFQATLSACANSEFPIVKKLITEYCLDDNDLRASQFLVAKFEGKIVGFGRLRQYPTCNELCSLGVVEELRLKGIGRSLSLSLISKSKLPLYTVTIIPEFFAKFGFTATNEYPAEIEKKLNYCSSVLNVPEKYVVMKK